MELLHHGSARRGEGTREARAVTLKARCASAWNEGEAMHAEWPSRMANDNGRSPLLPETRSPFPARIHRPFRAGPDLRSVGPHGRGLDPRAGSVVRRQSRLSKPERNKESG